MRVFGRNKGPPNTQKTFPLGFRKIIYMIARQLGHLKGWWHT
jgi:hypothetical protein